MAEFIERVCSSPRHGFTYIHSKSHEKSALESHIDKDLFSVFILLDGETDYIVEGKQLNVKEKDLLLVGNNELHHRVLKENTTCEYILLMFNLDFFIKMWYNLTDFEGGVFDEENLSFILDISQPACSSISEIISFASSSSKSSRPPPPPPTLEASPTPV